MKFDNLFSDNLTKEDIISALCLNDHEAISLFELSDNIRKEYCGDDVQIRGLVEISNICSRNCNYCGIRKDNRNVKRYRMSVDDIFSTATEMNRQGYRTIVMQSGESKTYSAEEIAILISRIKENCNMSVTLSLGEHSYNDYKLWKEAGADRYLLRHETANKNHYSFLHPDGKLETRLECLNYLKELGYQVGMGCMVGSPGQTLENLAEDVLLIKKFNPDMIGIGPYIMHKDTPFNGKANGSVFLTLKMLATVRIVSKKALMPATTALASIGNEGFAQGLRVGCDVIMINRTPQKYKCLYEIYPDEHCIAENNDTIY
ncbi:MAG: [FeFe] hydrogenase H-cluster radical SAM maturase HydE, partial [Armatimonadetes bacterium]|nr:[FeFe] hydrogenase H-cluster radical SAM maturase HydE [Candidatus Hippobium faecium]